MHRFKGKIMLWRSNLSSKTCQLQKWYGRLKSQKWYWLVSVCLSNHDKSFTSQKLKYQVKTPSRHNIAWIASFKGLQAFRFFSGLFTVFNLSSIKKTVKSRSHRGESGRSRVVQVSLDSPYVLDSQLHCDQSKTFSQTSQWDQAWEKETYLFTTRLLEAFSSNLFAVCGFWWKSTAWYIFVIVSNRFGPNSYLHTIFRRIADFSWYILFLSSLQEKQSRELFWLISERVRHFRPKVNDKIMLWK